MALAAHMREPDVDAMLARKGWRWFLEWQAYSALEPFGDARAAWHAAAVCATIANANRGKGQRSYKPENFIGLMTPPAPKGTGRTQTWKQQKDALFKALGYHEALEKQQRERRRKRR